MSGSNQNAAVKDGEDENLPDLGALTTAWNMGGPHYVALRLLFVAKLADRYITRLLAEEWGLAVAQWRVMAQLAADDHASVRDLARQAWVDRAEVSRAVSALERRGLVLREKNKADLRSPRFSLTPAGKALCDEFHPRWVAFQHEFVSALSEEEITQINNMLAGFASKCLDMLDEPGSKAARSDP